MGNSGNKSMGQNFLTYGNVQPMMTHGDPWILKPIGNPHGNFTLGSVRARNGFGDSVNGSVRARNGCGASVNGSVRAPCTE